MPLRPLLLLGLLVLSACAGARTGDLPLTIGPKGATGTLQPGPGKLTLGFDDTTCTARPEPVPTGTSAPPLFIGALDCRDGRRGKVSLTAASTPQEAYTGIVELDGLTTRVTYGTVPDPQPRPL